jgi:hypothetical protein
MPPPPTGANVVRDRAPVAGGQVTKYRRTISWLSTEPARMSGARVLGRKKKSRSIPLPRSVETTLDAALDRALDVQRPVILAYIDRQRGRGVVSPSQLITRMQRRYLSAVAAIGATSGGVGAVPGVGTATSVASAALEITAFVEATAVYALAVAEVHGVPTHDPALRRALVLGVLLGDAGAEVLGAGGVIGGWGKVLAQRGPESVSLVNAKLLKKIGTHFGARQGALVLGRAMPLGIGAGIGAAGNLALGRAAIGAVRKAFGPPPVQFPPRIIDAGWTPPSTPPPLALGPRRR